MPFVVNNEYVLDNKIQITILSRGFAWLDTGTHESLSEATEFVKAVEKRTGLKIACLEEIAINYKWIAKETITREVESLKGDYFDYLKKITSN